MSRPFVFALLAALALASCSSSRTETAELPVTPVQPTQSLADVVGAAQDLSVVMTLIDAAGLMPSLDGPDVLTLFAPSNEAFAALPAGTVETWLQPENQGELATRLSHHLVLGRIASSDLRTGQVLRTLSGESLQVRIANGDIQIGDATLIATNVDATNGIVHVTDTVLTP